MFEIKVYELGKVKLIIIVIGSKYIWLAWFQRWDYWDRDKLIISLAEESEHDPDYWKHFGIIKELTRVK